MKYIIVAGGVLSGLGKGITAASLGLLLQSRGIATTLLKSDMYLNIDAGTMNPIEHGEVFVTDDGLETDQDIGHYERFLGKSLSSANYITNGQLYRIVLDKERALEYDGRCVEPYHVLPPEIVKKWHNAGVANKADVVIVELGGTVGEYEGLLFYEAVRRIRLKSPEDIIVMLVGYLPAPPSIGELKSKPLQQAVINLNSLGVQPDFIIARAEKKIDNKRKEKISLMSGVSPECIIANPDVDTIYKIPEILAEQNVTEMVAEKLGLNLVKKDLVAWKKMLKKRETARKKVRIAVAGKYQRTGDYVLEDSYVCVVEAIKHAAWKLGAAPEIVWMDSETITSKSKKELSEMFSEINGVIVPQGWGKRGHEGKIKVAQYARENGIPYLGLCYGMQMAVIEFARNVLNLRGASSEEISPRAKHPVIHIIPKQKEYLAKRQFGGTIRLGAWPCKTARQSRLSELYEKYTESADAPWVGKGVVNERHRHRYEFNIKYKKRFEDAGMKITGVSPDGKLVEAVEIPTHPFYLGTQFHPEYLSRPLAPHPVFLGFIESALRG